jgi:two-component system chemotaxis sensor kinase CheA
VRRNIQHLKGSVEVKSRRGQGTAFLLRIPLTLAITEAMLVQIGEVVYAFPVESIQETVLFQPAMRTRVPGGAEVINLRGRSLRLARVDHMRCGGAAAERAILLVVQSTRGQFACLVDALLGQRQLVIKALPAFLGAVSGLSGCSILSDGGITLVVDPERLDVELAATREGRLNDVAPVGANPTGAYACARS